MNKPFKFASLYALGIALVLQCHMGSAWALAIDNTTQCEVEYSIELNAEQVVAKGNIAAHERHDPIAFDLQPQPQDRLLLVIHPKCAGQPNVDSRVATVVNMPGCTTTCSTQDGRLHLHRSKHCLPHVSPAPLVD